MSFERLETAAEVREIMSEIARQQIKADTPSANYGRVISVNVSALSATVWFPGDDAPISVNMFANNVPAQWQEQNLGSGNGVINTSFYGYGSQVAVGDFNGKKYITQVLTGSVMWTDGKMLAPNIVSQVATEVAADLAGTPMQLVGEPYETFINCDISNGSLSDGGAISFGPFTDKNSNLPGIGWIEMTITELNGATKFFRFLVNPTQDFQHTGGSSFLDDWFRIIPEQQICNPNPSQIIDFDVDVAIKRTAYGIKDDFTPSEEIWLRVVKRGNGWTGFFGQVTIRATNIQKGRALSGRRLFMQETLASPPAHKGFLGFHNSQHIYRDFDDYGVLDNFGRTISTGGGWGTSDSGPTWVSITGGPYGVDGFAGYMGPTGNYVSYMKLSLGSIENPDIYWDTWIDAMPTGAEVQSGVIARYTDTSNLIWLKVIFNTSGAITLSIVQNVAAVATVLGTDYTPGVSFTANQRIRCRARVFGVAMFIKCWNPATSREPDWVKIEAGAPFGTPNAAHTAGFFALPGAANSNTKPIRVYFDNVKASLYAKGQDNTGRQWHTGPWRSGLLRVADNLQKTWMITGRFFWGNDRLGWNGRIYFGGIGQHRMGLAAGSSIMQPPPPTASFGFTIPVVPSGSPVSVFSDGIPLSPGQSLWVAIPPGQTWENLYEYLFIVDIAAVNDFDMPEWAVFIAMRHDSTSYGPEIRLGNGQVLDKWRDVSFASGFANFGAGLQTCQYRVEQDGVIRLRGLAKHNTLNNATGTMFSLPAHFYMADDTQIFSVVSGNSFGTPGTSRIDIISTDVTINGHGTNGGTSYISISGITFTSNIV